MLSHLGSAEPSSMPHKDRFGPRSGLSQIRNQGIAQIKRKEAFVGKESVRLA